MWIPKIPDEYRERSTRSKRSTTHRPSCMGFTRSATTRNTTTHEQQNDKVRPPRSTIPHFYLSLSRGKPRILATPSLPPIALIAKMSPLHSPCVATISVSVVMCVRDLALSDGPLQTFSTASSAAPPPRTDSYFLPPHLLARRYRQRTPFGRQSRGYFSEHQRAVRFSTSGNISPGLTPPTLPLVALLRPLLLQPLLLQRAVAPKFSYSGWFHPPLLPSVAVLPPLQLQRAGALKFS